MVHPKDKVRDEEKTELVYRVPCKNCSSSYVGETGRKFGLRIKEHKKEVDSFTHNFIHLLKRQHNYT